MALSGAVATVMRQTTAAGTAFTDSPTTGDAAYSRYQINDPTLRYWDRMQPVTVKKNTVVQTAGFKIEHLSGFVVFDAALVSTDTVTVSGTAIAVAEAGGMFNWKLDIQQDVEDTTTFVDNGWKSFTPTLHGFSGSAEAYWANGDNTNLLLSGGDVIFLLYTDDGPSKRRYEMFGQMKKQAIDAPTKSVIKESIDFEGDGKLYYREG